MAFSAMNLSVPVIYENLENYKVSFEIRRNLGYPFKSDANPGSVVIIKPSFAKQQTNGTDRVLNEEQEVCLRCDKTFLRGVSREGCFYHKNKHSRNGKYDCCTKDVGSRGCLHTKLHVWSGLRDGMNGPYNDFIWMDIKNNARLDGHDRIFAIACEMCYTTAGMELIQVTIVDVYGKIRYNTYVQPEHEVVDFNTAYSGISCKHFRQQSNKKTLIEVQCDLKRIIKRHSFIIGHGLENDLRALKIMHNNVVDTSVVYPHYKGLPYRRPLKSLVVQILKRPVEILCDGRKTQQNAKNVMDLMLKTINNGYNNGVPRNF